MNPADAAQTSRVLAIDIRPRRLGYFCIEGSNRIVESKAIRFTSIDAAKIRIGTILSDLCPSVLVLRRTEPGSRRDQPRTRIIQRLLRKAAGLASVRVVFVAERQLLRHFPAHRCRNKHEVATFLVQQYPDLAWYQPRRRKAWEPEHRHMLIFDAAALAVVHLASDSA